MGGDTSINKEQNDQRLSFYVPKLEYYLAASNRFLFYIKRAIHLIDTAKLSTKNAQCFLKLEGLLSFTKKESGRVVPCSNNLGVIDSISLTFKKQSDFNVVFMLSASGNVCSISFNGLKVESDYLEDFFIDISLSHFINHFIKSKESDINIYDLHNPIKEAYQIILDKRADMHEKVETITGEFLFILTAYADEGSTLSDTLSLIRNETLTGEFEYIDFVFKNTVITRTVINTSYEPVLVILTKQYDISIQSILLIQNNELLLQGPPDILVTGDVNVSIFSNTFNAVDGAIQDRLKNLLINHVITIKNRHK